MNIYLWYIFLQFSVVSDVHCGIPFPWDDASQDELVALYKRHVYTVSDMLCVLLFRHHMVTSRRSVNRIIKRLSIRMRQNQHPLGIILRAIQHLHACGYSDVGYRTIQRILNVTLGLRFSQRTVQTILQVVDTRVRRRTAHRLRRRVYHRVGPNGVIHMDGYDKFKPFGFAIPWAICGYSRKILWLYGCPSNKDPKRVAFYFVHYLRKMQGVLTLIRTDAGTENREIHAIQVAPRLGHRVSMLGYRSVSFGRSTCNQRKF